MSELGLGIFLARLGRLSAGDQDPGELPREEEVPEAGCKANSGEQVQDVAAATVGGWCGAAGHNVVLQPRGFL